MSAQLPLRTCWVSGTSCWGGGAERGFHYSACARVTPGRGSQAADREPGAGAASQQTRCRGRAWLPGPSALTSPCRFRVALSLPRAFFCQFIKQRHSQGGVPGGGASLFMRGRGGSPGRATRQAQQHRAAARVGPRRPTRLPSLRGAGPPRPQAPPFLRDAMSFG